MPKEIVFEIDGDGAVTVEGKGFVGSECETLTRPIEEALGDVESRQYKPEFRQMKTAPRKAAAK